MTDEKTLARALKYSTDSYISKGSWLMAIDYVLPHYPSVLHNPSLFTPTTIATFHYQLAIAYGQLASHERASNASKPEGAANDLVWTGAKMFTHQAWRESNKALEANVLSPEDV